MKEKLIQLFERLSVWWYGIIAFVLYMGVQQVILGYVNRFEELTDGLPMIELPILVNRSLYEIAVQYPQEAIRMYQTNLQPLDIFLPLTAGLWFAVALAFLTKSIFPSTSNWWLLPLLGVLATFLDWAENIGVFFILRTLDAPITGLDILTRVFILTKTAV
ncbi:MAG: hypothetical protein AAF738_11560 [Bacteroidota bacterium]